MNVVMPETANLVKWHKCEGDSVKQGDVFFEIETDKTVMEIEAASDGVVRKIFVLEGATAVAADTLLAELAINGELIVAHGDSVAQPPTDTRVLSSPLARKLAREAGIDLASVRGTGPNGRVVERDVKALAVVAVRPGPKPDIAREADMAVTGPFGDIRKLYEGHDHKAVPLDGMRRTIADRLVQSKQTIPHFYLKADIQLDALESMKKALNAAAPHNAKGERAYKISINDFVVKALALALQRVPQANAVWAGDCILRFSASSVGVAVAVEGGLYTPVLHRLETKRLSEVSAEIASCAARARGRTLRAEEYSGGVTAVSNLGMHGVTGFSAIINPPHSSILAVGAASNRLVVKDGAPSVVRAMTVTLSCDHRVIDGAIGAQLLAAFQSLMEAPVAILA